MGNFLKVFSLIALTWFLYYVFMPTLSLDNYGMYFFIGFILLVASLLFYTDNYDYIPNIPLMSSSGIVIGSLLVFSFATSCSVFHSSSYQQMIGDIPTQNYNGDIQPIDPNNIIIIDDVTARRLGDKKLANGDEIVGSQVEIGEYTLQEVGDHLYYVAPLLHSGFFKYMNNTDGTDGYIMVSATDNKDVRYVPNYKIQYQPEAYWSRDLSRHLRFNGYLSQYFNTPEFEIDDEGNPFWVMAKYEKKVGFSGHEAVALILVDASTGNITEYDLDEVPEWVDRVHPSDFVETQLFDWGNYIHGWWNPSNKDEVKPTPGTSVVYGNDGMCYYYTGITSVGKDGTILGFVLTNTRDKSTTYYRMAGATESKAMNSAEGAVQEKGYNSSYPRPYNINGELTYVMALKDNEGLIKKVAMVSVSNYEIVSVGDDIRETVRDFKTRMNSFIGTDVLNSDVSYKKFEGVVSRINQDSENGYYYILLEGGDKIISLTSEISEEILITQPNDSVVIYGFPSNTSIIDGVEFDNKFINLTISDEQMLLETEQDSILSVNRTENIEESVENKWDQLTTEQKDSILNR